MDTLDSQLKEFLLRERTSGVIGRRPETGYPAPEDFYLYLSDELEGEALERMLAHLKSSPRDQTLVARARELMESLSESNIESAPRHLVQKAKGLMGERTQLKCPHCGKSITPFDKPVLRQNWRNRFWFLMTVFSFLLSFALPRYFLQFLAAALLCGFKWAVDQKATKTQIMIYRALQEDTRSDRQDSHRISSG